MHPTLRSVVTVAIVTTVAATLAGCTSASPDQHEDQISIVASTNVWGDVAQQIGGTAVAVTSIISDSAQDPHSYEGSARVQLELSKAGIVIKNGGGYDDFMDTLLRGLREAPTIVLDAVDISGFSQTRELNEHVWYDLPTVSAVASKIADTLIEHDPQNSSIFAANETAFNARLAKLGAEEAAIKGGPHAGAGVMITEPVPLYLLSASGLVDMTPEGLSDAIEDGTGVAPEILRDAISLLNGDRVKLLVYNEQTMGSESRHLIAAAKMAGVPTVAVTETLPAGKHFADWMSENLRNVKKALG